MTVRLDGIDLAIFDKDGTLIDFGSMWSGWAVGLAEELRVATGRPMEVPLFAMLGYDAATGVVLPGGGLRIAIATSDDRDPTERTIAALGLAVMIDALVCADDGIPVKPAPDMVLHLCAATAVGPARTAVVGDSPADLRMARSAGAGLVIGVLTGVGERADLEPLADVVVGSVDQLG